MTTPLAENTRVAQYEGIAFPVTDSSLKGDHTAAVHMAYRRPSADVEPTGLAPYEGTLSIPLVNADWLVSLFGGPLYPDLRDRLVARFEQTPIGRLVHPTRGDMTVKVGPWIETATAHQQGGAIYSLSILEHSNSAQILLSEDNSTPQDYENVTSDQAAAADVAASQADPTGSTGYSPVSPTVATQLAVLALPSPSFGQVGGAIREMVSAIDGNLNLPGLATASFHDVTTSLYTLRSTVFALRARLLGNIARAKTYTTRRTMAAWEVAQEGYGDQSLSDLIVNANPIEDPLAIAANTVLILPPAPV